MDEMIHILDKLKTKYVVMDINYPRDSADYAKYPCVCFSPGSYEREVGAIRLKLAYDSGIKVSLVEFSRICDMQFVVLAHSGSLLKFNFIH
jgi:hypothetical protein